MSPIRAVLDACVLVPAPLRDTLLRAAHAGLYQSFWSDELLTEVRRTLVTDGLTSADAADRLVARMHSAFPESIASGYESLIEHMTNNPKVRHVLAAAVKVQAQFIVTANLSDFPDRALEPYGIAAVSPDEFLTDLFTMSPDIMVEIVGGQAADLRNPPRTVHEVLGFIARTAPQFADLVRREVV